MRSRLMLLAMIGVLAACTGRAQSTSPAGGPTYTGFGLRLFREMAGRDPDANIFISPASAAWALAMTAEGASGVTLDEMTRVLGTTTAAAGDMDVMSSLRDQHDVELRIANSVWADAGRPVLGSFLTAVQRKHGGEAVSMVLHGPAAKNRINQWVSDATHGKITGILTDTLPETAVMELVNAVYFKGAWLHPFEKDGTKPHPFTRPDGTVVSRPLMTLRGEDLVYLRDSGFQALRLGYLGNRVAMYVFLPDSGTALSSVVARFDSTRWERWMHAFSGEHYGRVMLPKFRFENGVSLVAPLKALGMRLAFDRGQATFGRMFAADYLSLHHVYVTDAVQKTFVDVSERGTEAAAATAVGVTDDGFTDPPVTFIVDRPFCVAIRDDRTGAILFLGQITDPGAAH